MSTQELVTSEQCKKEEERSSHLESVYIKTFGCQMNEYDTEKMLTVLSANYQPVDTFEQAHLVIVNTCSVREKGEHKLRSLLGKLYKHKTHNPELVIGVGGCVAQQEGVRIINENPGVDFVVGTHNLSLIPSLVQASKEGRGSQVAVDYRDEWEELPDCFLPDNASQLGSSVCALISIQRGCNKRCSFCVVPNTRGPEVSRNPDEIEREVRLKVRLGAKEVLLLGQTVNSYGKDLSPRYSFEKLIRRLSQIEGVLRIRFISPHPQEVKEEFISLYGEVPTLCPHIHLPLQSGSDRILRLMNRNYRTKRYLEIVDSLRKACPQIAITSDIIVGFPTESAEDFEQTLQIIKEVKYNSLYSFTYSIRPHTPAADFTASEEVSHDLASARLSQLKSIQNEIGFQLNKAKLGSIMEVLVEGRSKKISSQMWGRNPQNTFVNLLTDQVIDQEKTDQAKIGELIAVKAEECGPASFQGRPLLTTPSMKMECSL